MLDLRTKVDIIAAYMVGKGSECIGEPERLYVFPFNMLEELFDLPREILYLMPDFLDMVSSKVKDYELIDTVRVLKEGYIFEVYFK